MICNDILFQHKHFYQTTRRSVYVSNVKCQHNHVDDVDEIFLFQQDVAAVTLTSLRRKTANNYSMPLKVIHIEDN